MLLAFTYEPLRRLLADHGLVIFLVVVAAFVGVRLVRRAIPATIKRTVMRQASPLTESDLEKRSDTLSGVLLGIAQLAIVLLALLLVLDEVGINVLPVVAGLGIGGIAIGLGAQSLVKDAINGMLILTENQYGKGDMVTIAGVQGWVEEVNLRRTVLRDIDGTLHSVPNGAITVSSNLTRGFSGINLLVSLAAGTDVEQGMELINRIGQEMAEDAILGPMIVEAPYSARMEGATATTLDVRVFGRVAPGKQWEVASALRRRLVRTFDAEGIKFGPIQPAPPAPAPPITAPARNQ